MTCEDHLMEHLITEITENIPAFEFLRDRIEGHELSQGCNAKNEYSSIFLPEILGGNANEVKHYSWRFWQQDRVCYLHYSIQEDHQQG